MEANCTYADNRNSITGFIGLHPDAMLTERQVAAALGVVARTIRRMVAAGDMPQPILVGHRRLWRVSRLTGWLGDKEAQAEENARKQRENDVAGRARIEQRQREQLS